MVPTASTAYPPVSRTTGLHRLGDVAMILVTMLTALIQAAFAAKSVQASDNAALTWWAGLSMLAAIGLPFLLLLRNRYPYAIAIGTGAATVLLAIDPLLALVGLSALISRSKERRVWWAIGLTTAATALAFLRDSSRHVSASVSKTLIAPTDQSPITVDSPDLNIPLWTAIPVTVVAVALATVIGILLRSRSELNATRVARHQERRTTEGLRADLARKAERELVAQEAHDTLAHRLSLVSLQAEALEMAIMHSSDETVASTGGELGAPPTPATGPTPLVDRARALRTQSVAAAQDVRNLVEMLRDPAPFMETLQTDDPGIGLMGLPELFDDCRSAGSALSVTVFVTALERLDPVTSRAAYRIVQESLTNARRHAGSAPVVAFVSAHPTTGIEINISNELGGQTQTGRLPSAAPPGSTPLGTASPVTARQIGGRGLAGIEERVRMLRGTLATGITDDQVFRVDAHLPWRERPVPPMPPHPPTTMS